MNEIIDGYDHYGTGAPGRLNMLDGAWSAVNPLILPTTTRPRTGTHSLEGESPVGGAVARRAFITPGPKKFVGQAYYVNNLPTADDNFQFCQFIDAIAEVATFTLTSTGSVQIRDGGPTGTVVAESTPLIFVEGVFQHVECMLDNNGASGAAEVRVNGVVAASIAGHSFGAAGDLEEFLFGHAGSANGAGDWWVDDLRTGDDLGGINDDFMGDKRVLTQFPTADSTPQEWTPSSGGSAFAMVDEPAPDEDATYIESATPGFRSRMTFDPLPDGVAAITGVAYAINARKTDVGECFIAVNQPSGDDTGLGTEIALTEAYAYKLLQNFDVNPDNDGPWSVAALDAAPVEIEHIPTSS